ncbi:MAG: translocation/assembly module TamB domain-containing protein, partial [Bacteroides sp.]
MGIILLLNIPSVQHRMTVFVTNELKQILNTELTVGKIDIGLLNRIIIDDVLLNDREGKEMLKVTRLSAKFDILPLFKGRIAISSVQLFGFNINLNKVTPEAVPNFKFVIDALASKDKTKKKTNLDLRINSILIRRGKLSYDVISEPQTPGKFNAQHVKIQNIIANISLKALNSDSINGSIKRMSFNEQSGLKLDKLSLKILANSQRMSIENFTVNMPGTSIKMKPIKLRYDSLQSFKDFANKVKFSGKMKPSYITLHDISCFVPALSNFRDELQLEMEVSGTINQLSCPRLEIKAGNDLQIVGDVSFQDLSQGNDAFVFGHLSKLHVNRGGTDFLVRNLAKNYSGTPDILKRLGDISFQGEVSGYFDDIVTYGVFNTSLGVVKTDVKISNYKEKGTFAYSGAVKTNQFQLGKLFDKEDLLGKISFNLDVKGINYKNARPDVSMKGLISSIDYSHYEYKNVELDGKYQQGGFDGKASLNDENGTVLVNGNFNIAKAIPTFNIQANIQNLRPYNLHLINEREGSELSLKVDADFSGSSIDNVIGEINIDSVLYTAPEKHYFLDEVKVTATQHEGTKQLSLYSSFLNATVKGQYSYQTIPTSVMKTIEHYIPSLLTTTEKKKEPLNDFTFDIDILNTDILSEVFNIPLAINERSTVKGYFNDKVGKIRIEGYFPSFNYGNSWFESGMILCENPSKEFKCNFRAANHLKNGAMLNISLEAKAENDKLKTTINWGNNAPITYSGKFAAVTNFFRTAGDKSILQANVEVKPTEVILNDTIWNIHSSKIQVDSGRVFVDNFLFQHKDQYLRVNGKLTKEIKDTVKVELKDISLAYVFDIIQFRAVEFTGRATGTVFINQTLKSPMMNTRLFVKDFAFNGGPMGDMNIYGEWDKEQEGIYLDARMKEKELARTNVKGFIFIKKKGLDLNIEADGTNLQFLQTYMDGIASNMQGRVKGNIRLVGGFKSLDLLGSAMASASCKINILNTSFIIKHDSVRLDKEGIRFDDITINDPEGHSGKVNGYLHFRHFKNLNYRFMIDVNNMLVFNTKESPDIPFYGTVYGTGNTTLNGNPNGLNVDVAMRTNRNTNFVYITKSTSSATNNQFVTFVDKTPRRAQRDSISLFNNYQQEEKKTPMNIRLNLQVEATPEASMKIIIDPSSGDYISGRGNGNVRVDFFNKGDVKMFGDYDITQGIYKFSLQEVIRKDFVIKSGSNISFNGAPLDASLDIKASYTVNS